MVLADPRLLVAEVVEALDQLEVAVQVQRRVLDGMWNGAMNTPKRIGQSVVTVTRGTLRAVSDSLLTLVEAKHARACS